MWEKQRTENSAISLATVATVHSPAYLYQPVREAVESALGLLNFSRRIKPGDKVLIKPYLADRGQPIKETFGRRTSHPLVITAVVELLRDCGAIVSLGDEGSRRYRDARIPEGREWLYEMAKRTGVTLVSFAKAGAVSTRSSVFYPRDYLITRAVLDVDLIFNCANGQPHCHLLLSGAVRNMFNALIGNTQEYVYKICKDKRQLADIIADVCSILRPAFSLIDLTNVLELDASNAVHPVNLIVAGEGPASVDTVAAHALGWQDRIVWTTQFAARRGLGHADMEQIKLLGLSRSEFPKAILDIPNSFGSDPHERVLETVGRLVNSTVFRPRPVVTEHRCNGCGDCRAICPVGAVALDESEKARIHYNVCKDCGLCIEACTSEAIALNHLGLAKVLRQIKHGGAKLWNQSKIGVQLPAGPVSVSIRLAHRVKVSSNHRSRLVQATNLPMEKIQRGETDIPEANTNAETCASLIPLCRGQLALIVGAGAGLGTALAVKFADVGMDLAVAARNTKKLQSLVEGVRARGSRIGTYGCDAQQERSVTQLFRLVEKDLGDPDLVIYNVEHFIPGGLLDIEAPAFEECWRAMSFGAFLVGKEAAKRMVARGKGTIIFTGATASLRGSAGYINLAVGKFGIRALAQSMARELGPKGVHVAHVILDGGILSKNSARTAKERMSDLFPQEIANTYLHLYRQHPSAWSQEVDLRPWVEKF